jgi:hypothetical protein
MKLKSALLPVNFFLSLGLGPLDHFKKPSSLCRTVVKLLRIALAETQILSVFKFYSMFLKFVQTAKEIYKKFFQKSTAAISKGKSQKYIQKHTPEFSPYRYVKKTYPPHHPHISERQFENYTVIFTQIKACFKGTVQRQLTGGLSGINRKYMTCHCSDGHSFFNLKGLRSLKSKNGFSAA